MLPTTKNMNFLTPRQRVKEQIARDRADRAAKEANKGAPAQCSTVQLTPAAIPAAPAASSAPKKEYDTSRLQVINDP